MIVFAKVIPKTLLVLFFPDTVYNAVCLLYSCWRLW